MRILSIDTSLGTGLLVCEAAEGSVEVLFSQYQPDSRRHAESLGPMLAEALADERVAAAALDAVVAARGPAPFTGLRAGLVTARTVGRARRIPVHGVPSLDAVARAALDEGADLPAGTVVRVLTDARRKEVYTAAYRARGHDDVERLSEIEVVRPSDMPRDVQVVAGSGAALYPEAVGGLPVLAPVSGDALTQVRLALSRLGRGQELGTEPLYLRHADVQMPTAPKRYS